MLRVNSDSISNINGKSYYKGELFSGVSFSIFDCKVVDAKKYKDGVVLEGYVNEYFRGLEEGERVVSDCLEPEDEDYDEPVTYEKNRFTGIAYDFDGDFCSGELHYKNGWLESELTYYFSGAIEVLELTGQNFSQKYSWYEDGKINRYEIFQKGILGIRLEFDQLGRVIVLSIEGQYFEELCNIVSLIKHPIFDEKKSFDKISGGDRLNIYGSSVDDEVFSRLFDNGGLDNTAELRISGTALSEESIEKISHLPKINSLVVESKDIKERKMKDLKLKRSGCYVEFNGEEVIV